MTPTYQQSLANYADGQNDPLNLGEYMMTASAQPQPPRPGSNAQVLSAFPEYTVAFADAPRNFGAFNATFGRAPLTSPTMEGVPFAQPHRNSISNIPDGPSPAIPVARHRNSIGSPGEFGDRKRVASNGLDPAASPESSHAYGLNSTMDNPKGSEAAGVASTTDGSSVDTGETSTKPKKEDKGEPPPPWSEMKTKAGKERKRLPLACIACRRKKIRCSGEKPACKHCLRSRIPCVYKVTARKAAPRTDYMAMLDKRLKRMEDRVIKLIPKESHTTISDIPRAVVKPAIPGPPPKAGSKKRGAEEAFGTELDGWARSKASGSRSGHPPSAIKGLESDESQLLTEGADSLPSKELQEHLAETYFDNVYGQSYPLLHKPSFMRRLAAGDVPPVLILAVCAISARFSSHPEIRTEPAFLRGEQWAGTAREIALRRYDRPNITILIVYLLLGLHEFGTCQGGRSWMFGGMAQRMAYALQLHRDLDYDPLEHDKEKQKLSFTDREIRRRTMWSCFLMDRFNSSGTDRPLFVNEQFIRAQLPIKEQFFQQEIPGPTEDLEGSVPNPLSADDGHAANPKENMGIVAHLVRLVAIWGRVVKYMNLGGKDKDEHPMWSPQSTLHDLAAQAENFEASLPESLLYNSENLQTHATERTANQYLYLHILYQQVILFMNRFALPSTAGVRLPKDMPHQFLTKAAQAAHDAANQISILINESMDHNVVAPFAGYCAFFSSTVHVHGVFSKNSRLEALSKKYLAYNVKYLSKMKKYWGMFHFVSETLKEHYRQHADAAQRGPSALAVRPGNGKIFQYGDWFDRYPHGVSRTDYEDPAVDGTKEPGTDAVLSQKSDLQSVEEFFASLSPPSRAEQQRKMARKSRHQKSASQSDANTAKKPIASGPQDSNGQQEQLPRQRPGPIPLSREATTGPQFDASAFYSPVQTDTLPASFANDVSLIQPMLYSTYGMDPSSATTPQSHINDLAWNFDLAGLAAPSFFGDPSTAWFVPFNMDPPDIGRDVGLFGAGQDFGFQFTDAGTGAPAAHAPSGPGAGSIDGIGSAGDEMNVDGV